MPFEGWFWKSAFKKLFNKDDEKCSKISTVTGTGWENEISYYPRK